jgi:hypothetical protein
VFQELEFFETEALEFELVEAGHVCYMGDGDMFKMEDVGDEKANSWNAMCIYPIKKEIFNGTCTKCHPSRNNSKYSR